MATLNVSNINKLRRHQVVLPGTGAEINAATFQQAMSGFVSQDKVIRKAYYSSLLGRTNLGMRSWLQDFMGEDTFNMKKYTLAQYGFLEDKRFTHTNALTIAPGGTGILNVAVADIVNSNFVLPAVGEQVLLSDRGAWAEVKLVNVVAPNDVRVTVELVAGQAAVTLPANSEVLVVRGSFVKDCDLAPITNSFPQLPYLQDLEMKTIGKRYKFCDVREDVQNFYIPIVDENGHPTDTYLWADETLKQMYLDHEEAVDDYLLMYPTTGFIPTLRARALRFETTSAGTWTLSDFEELRQKLIENRVNTFDFTLFADSVMFMDIQRLCQTTGNSFIQQTEYKVGEDRTLEMYNYVKINIAGLKITLIEDQTSTYRYGAKGWKQFSGILIPNSDRNVNLKPKVGTSIMEDKKKAVTITYYEGPLSGVHKNLTDEAGFISKMMGRVDTNIYGINNKNQEYGIETTCVLNVHEPQSFILINHP